MNLGGVELLVPADSGMLLAIRMTTAGVLARAGLTADMLEDMKTVVAEAFSCLISQSCVCPRVRIVYQVEGGALTVSLCGEGAPAPDCGCMLSEDELKIVVCIFESMVDAVDMRREPSGQMCINLTKQLSR